MKKLLLIPVILLCLPGAMCSRSQPAVMVRTVEVPIVHVEQCVATADVPKRPAALPKRPAGAAAALDLAFAKVLEWITYGDKADAVLQGCAAKP